VDPVVTLVIDHGHVVGPGPDPVAEALLTAVMIGVMVWQWARLWWWIGRRRRTRIVSAPS
jgi:hypothetical protein